MNPSSSTSNFKRWTVVAVLLLGGGLLLLKGAGPLSRFLSVKLAASWITWADGRLPDAASTLAQLISEMGAGLVVAGVATALAAAGWRATRSMAPARRFLLCTTLLLIAANAAAALASHSLLFWLAASRGDPGLSAPRFEINRHFARLDAQAGQPVWLVQGSSQANTTLDERILENLGCFGARWRDAHYPGNKAFEILATWRRLDRHPPDGVVCYVSEETLFGPSEGLALGWMSDLRLARDWRSLSDTRPGPMPRTLRDGIIGYFLPLFRYNEAFSTLVLGADAVLLPQTQGQGRVEGNLSARARKMASRMNEGSVFDYQRAALRRWCEETRAANCQVVLLVGDVNPLLARELDPKIRPLLESTLRELAREFPHIRIPSPGLLPSPVEADFKDLLHMRPSARDAYTRVLADWLKQTAPEPSPSPTPGRS
jgi:hypothetical protein